MGKKIIEMAISRHEGKKLKKQGHFLFSNFKSCRKESALTFLIFGSRSEIWLFSDFEGRNQNMQEIIKLAIEGQKLFFL